MHNSVDLKDIITIFVTTIMLYFLYLKVIHFGLRKPSLGGVMADNT
jgi:hypothetical protein